MVSARYTNADHTIGILSINGTDWSGPIPPNAGDLRAIYDRWAQEGGVAEPYVAPPMQAPREVTDPLDFWRRCTIAEAETVNQVALTMPIRDQQVFARASVFDHADPDTGRLKDMLTQAFGAARAAELLAPS